MRKLDRVQRGSEQPREFRQIGRAAHDVVVGPAGGDGPDGCAGAKGRDDAVVGNGSAHLEFQRHGTVGTRRALHVELDGPSIRVPLPSLGAAQELSNFGCRDVGDQATEFEQQWDRRQTENGKAPNFLTLHAAAHLLGEAGPEIAYMSAPEVGIVVGQIEGRKVEVDPTVVEWIAVWDHRPLQVAFGDRRLVCPDPSRVPNDVAAEILVDGGDGPDACFVAALHRRQNLFRMLGDHLAVEYAVVHVTDEHQVVGIVGEKWGADQIPARAVGRVGDDMPDVGRVRVRCARDLIANEKLVAPRILAAARRPGPDDVLDPLRLRLSLRRAWCSRGSALAVLRGCGLHGGLREVMRAGASSLDGG